MMEVKMKKQIRFEHSVPRKVLGQRGFGLIEVMVAAAIISIIALGIATLIDDMLKMQKKTNTVGVIVRMKEQITAAVQNGESWALTAQDAAVATGNPNFDCLRNTGQCGDAETGPLNLKGAGGVPVYYATTAGHGFTLQGTLCATYPSTECPFRWDLTYELTCPPTIDPCDTPDVRVRGILQYTEATVSMPGGFNSALYEIDIRRGSEAIRNDGLTVSFIQAGAVGEGAGCEGGWVQRRLNTVTNDPANNVVNKAGAALTTANVIILRPGTYNCRVQSPAFKNGGNRLRLRSTAGNTVGPVVSSGTASRSGGSANLSLDTTFVLSVDTTIVVEQRCEVLPSSTGFWQGFPGAMPANYDTWSLGVPIPDPGGGYTGGTTYTSVSCARTS